VSNQSRPLFGSNVRGATSPSSGRHLASASARLMGFHPLLRPLSCTSPFPWWSGPGGLWSATACSSERHLSIWLLLLLLLK
jgi:hypothetical protein